MNSFYKLLPKRFGLIHLACWCLNEGYYNFGLWLTNWLILTSYMARCLALRLRLGQKTRFTFRLARLRLIQTSLVNHIWEKENLLF